MCAWTSIISNIWLKRSEQLEITILDKSGLRSYISILWTSRMNKNCLFIRMQTLIKLIKKGLLSSVDAYVLYSSLNYEFKSIDICAFYDKTVIIEPIMFWPNLQICSWSLCCNIGICREWNEIDPRISYLCDSVKLVDSTGVWWALSIVLLSQITKIIP
jgi:hypothetical protein